MKDTDHRLRSLAADYALGLNPDEIRSTVRGMARVETELQPLIHAVIKYSNALAEMRIGR